MRTNAIVASVALLLLVGCASSTPHKSQSEPQSVEGGLLVPPDLRESVRKSSFIGRQLFALDKAAAIGTDALFENVKDLKQPPIGGYIPLQDVDESGHPQKSFSVSFFTAEPSPRIAYEVRVTLDTKPTFQAFGPPKAASVVFASLIRARQAALAAMPRPSQPINPILLPGEANGERGILVYLLAGTKAPNVAVFGRHFRALVSADASRVTYMMPMSNTALEMPTRGPTGAEPEALVVSHVVTDFPLETHVFTSLIVAKPVFVATSRGLWRVDGDKIDLVSDKVPQGRK